MPKASTKGTTPIDLVEFLRTTSFAFGSLGAACGRLRLAPRQPAKR